MQNEIWRSQDEIHGVVVDLDDLRILGNAGVEVGAGGRNAVRPGQDVVGSEGIDVLELEPREQMEAPAGGLLRYFPTLRQRGNDLQILVACDQAFIDVAQM